jgi:integrase
VVDLMLATGARIGEALAVRWQDLDLTGDRPVVTISGTIVYLKPAGLDQVRRRLPHRSPPAVRRHNAPGPPREAA